MISVPSITNVVAITESRLLSRNSTSSKHSDRASMGVSTCAMIVSNLHVEVRRLSSLGVMGPDAGDRIRSRCITTFCAKRRIRDGVEIHLAVPPPEQESAKEKYETMPPLESPRFSPSKPSSLLAFPVPLPAPAPALALAINIAIPHPHYVHHAGGAAGVPVVPDERGERLGEREEKRQQPADGHRENVVAPPKLLSLPYAAREHFRAMLSPSTPVLRSSSRSLSDHPLIGIVMIS